MERLIYVHEYQCDVCGITKRLEVPFTAIGENLPAGWDVLQPDTTWQPQHKLICPGCLMMKRIFGKHAESATR